MSNTHTAAESMTVSTRSVRSTDQDIPGGYPDSIQTNPGVSTQQSLSQAVYARRAEFTRQHSVRIKVGTWNVAGFKGTENDLGGWFVDGKGISESLSGLSLGEHTQHNSEHNSGHGRQNGKGQGEEDPGEQEERSRGSGKGTLPKKDNITLSGGPDIGIYALGLQEIVDITSAKHALRPFTDPTESEKFKKALEQALPAGYQLVAEQQLIGLLLLIYASPTVAPHLRSVSTTSVGTGLMGYMGNKGACTARLVLGETTRLVFINCHMSAGTGEKEVGRRNWDAEQITTRTRFDPVVNSAGECQEPSEKIGDEDFAFWFGDLNYRLEGIPPEDVRRILMLHTREEYDVGQLSEQKITKEISGSQDQKGSSTTDHQKAPSDPRPDPASLQTTIDSLLSHDELYQQQKSRKCFHDGWREGPITFLPTYKYDVNTVGVFDSGAKKRGPSWCDRIIYRTRSDRLAYEHEVKEEREAKRKEDDMKAQGIIDKAVDDESMLFEYDPDADGEDCGSDQEGDYQPRKVLTKTGYEDTIALEYYLSHQRVLSSDHKPLEAVFALHYDAVVPELKSTVQQEVARDIDRAENEGRPVVTIAVDKGPHHAHDAESDGVDFGNVRYSHTKFRSVTVANTGRVPALFGFVNRISEPGHSPHPGPAWLTIDIEHEPNRPRSDPKQSKFEADDGKWAEDVLNAYTLLPGESSTIGLVAEIRNMDLVRDLNSGASLEDVLVLRVKDGRDHFLPIRGTWSASSHGRTIDRLIRIPEGGVRKLQHQRPSGSPASPSPLGGIWSRTGTAGMNNDENAVILWSAPREIFRLTEAIEALVERVVAEWGMVGQNEKPPGQPAPPPWKTFAGWPFVEESWTLEDVGKRRELTSEINEALDTDQSFDKLLPADLLPLHRLEVFAETLLDFLRNLEDGVITESLWSELEKSVFNKDRTRLKVPTSDDQRAAITEVLSSSPPRSISFVILTSMLARIVQEVAGTTEPDILLPSPPSGPSSRTSVESPPLASPKVTVRKNTLDQDPAIARRQLVCKNFAAVFEEILVRVPQETAGTGSKSKSAATLNQRRELIEVFLESDTP